jgi:hypothetical protein
VWPLWSWRGPGWPGNRRRAAGCARFAAQASRAAFAGNDPGSHDFQINTSWLGASLIAATLPTWLRLLALDGDLARAEPKTLRYKILHAAARITRGARRRQLRIQASWPWAADIVTAFGRISALAHAP